MECIVTSKKHKQRRIMSVVEECEGRIEGFDAHAQLRDSCETAVEFTQMLSLS